MSAKFRLPFGSLSRRIYGAEMELRERAARGAHHRAEKAALIKGRRS